MMANIDLNRCEVELELILVLDERDTDSLVEIRFRAKKNAFRVFRVPGARKCAAP